MRCCEGIETLRRLDNGYRSGILFTRYLINMHCLRLAFWALFRA